VRGGKKKKKYVRDECLYLKQKSLRIFGFLMAKGREKEEKKRLKRPIIREYHRHRGPQRTETKKKTYEKQYQAQTTKTAESFKEKRIS
jgi:hypothetical protein